jgi:hypothetical protein
MLQPDCNKLRLYNLIDSAHVSVVSRSISVSFSYRIAVGGQHGLDNRQEFAPESYQTFVLV